MRYRVRELPSAPNLCETVCRFGAGVAQLVERQPSKSPSPERCALNSGSTHESGDSGPSYALWARAYKSAAADNLLGQLGAVSAPGIDA